MVTICPTVNDKRAGFSGYAKMKLKEIGRNFKENEMSVFNDMGIFKKTRPILAIFCENVLSSTFGTLIARIS